jgi:hypothetical protein
MWYALIFVITINGPLLYVEPTPYQREDSCIEAASDAGDTIAEYAEYVAVSCQRIKGADI